MNEQKLLSEAQQIVGQDDVLLAAGVFQPRGTQAGMSGGAATGGGLARGVAGLALSAAGIAAGERAATTAARGLSTPRWTVLAVSADRIYGLTGHGEGLAIRPGEVFAVLSRDEVTTKVHERVGVRVVEIIENGAGAALELETARLGGWHGADVLRLLS